MPPVTVLNRRVLVQRPSGARDAIGQPVPDDWVDVAPLWANIKHQSGVSAIRANADASTVPASIRVRYRTDLDAAMRILHGSTVYAIKAVMPDEQSRQYTDIACEVTR